MRWRSRRTGRVPVALVAAGLDNMFQHGHQGHQLVAGVGPTLSAAQIQTPISQFTQTQAEGQGGGKHQPDIGHQTMIVKGDFDAFGALKW